MFQPRHRQIPSLPQTRPRALRPGRQEPARLLCRHPLGERANPYNWPPPASGFRTQTLPSAREVPRGRPGQLSAVLWGREEPRSLLRTCVSVCVSVCLPLLLPLIPLSLSSSRKAPLSWELGVGKHIVSRPSAADPSSPNRKGQVAGRQPRSQGKVA